MPFVSITADKRKLARVQKLLANVPRAVPKVMSRAVNRTATMTRTVIVRKIAAASGMKKKDIRDGIIIHKATQSHWAATLYLVPQRVPLILFGARQTSRGVTYRLGPNKKRRVAPGLFIESMPSGHRGVFGRGNRRRLPIYERYGPSVMGVFQGAEDLARKTVAEGDALLARNIDMQVRRILDKKS